MSNNTFVCGDKTRETVLKLGRETYNARTFVQTMKRVIALAILVAQYVDKDGEITLLDGRPGQEGKTVKISLRG